MPQHKRRKKKQPRYKRPSLPTVFRQPENQRKSFQSSNKGEMILGVLLLVFVAFMIEMADGFSSWTGWVIVLVCGICIAIVSYFELSAKNKIATRTEILLATTTKWIIRLLSGSLIVLLLGFYGYAIDHSFISPSLRIKDVLLLWVLNGLFIFFLIHFFIYGGSPRRYRSLKEIRATYYQRKKRYHWKW